MKLTPDEAVTALRALYTHPSGAYHNDATAEAIRYIDAVRIVPEWVIAWTAKTDLWLVRHDGVTYKTQARSRADAVNNVRFNLYGRKPESECGAFDAVCPAFVMLDSIGAVRRGVEAATPRDLFGQKTISKSDALARLRRMAS